MILIMNKVNSSSYLLDGCIHRYILYYCLKLAINNLNKC